MDTISIASDIFARLVAGMHERLLPVSDALFASFFLVVIAAICVSFIRHDTANFTKGMLYVLGAALVWGLCKVGPTIGQGIMDMAVSAGLRAGGSGMSANTFMTQPDKIYYAGLAHAYSLYDVADQICGVMDWQCGGSGVPAFPLRALAWGIGGAFAFLAVANFFAWVFFSVCVPLSIMVAPFAIMGITRGIGAAPLRFAARSFAYMFALAMVSGFSDLLATAVIKTVEPSFWAAFPVLVLLIMVLSMVWMARYIADTMVGGGIETAGKIADLAGGAISAAATSYFVSRQSMRSVVRSDGARSAVDGVSGMFRFGQQPFSGVSNVGMSRPWTTKVGSSATSNLPPPPVSKW